MALIKIGFFSETLRMCANCTVILPQLPDADAPAKKFPTLYLLHGISRSNSAWQRMTRIEHYALTHGVAVVMPDGSLSSYADMKHGLKYFSFIADELPKVMRNFFPLSDKREENFICGASMGGYGALKIGLSRPEQYAAIGSLSSGISGCRACLARLDDRGLSLEELTFGKGGLDAEEAAIVANARAIAESGENAPRVFITCGSEDTRLLESTRRTRDFFQSFPGNPFDLEYTEHPGGHDWGYWDAHICDFLRFAGLKPGGKLL